MFPFTNAITGGGGALVRPRIKSPDYVTGVSGWTVNQDGTAEFQDATIRGSLALGGTSPAAREVIGGTVPAELVTYYAAGSPETVTAPETVVALVSAAYDGQGNYVYQVLVVDSSAPMEISSLAIGKVISGVVTEFTRTVLNPNIGGGTQTDYLDNAVFFESAANTGLDVIVAGIVTDAVGRWMVDAGGSMFLGPGGPSNVDCVFARAGSQKFVTDALVFNTAAAGNDPVAETWHALTLSNSWTGTLRYKKVPSPSPAVYVSGSLTPGTKTDGTTVATLPSGYRPASGTDLACVVNAQAGANAQTPHFNINATTGVLTCWGWGSATSGSLNAIFPLD